METAQRMVLGSIAAIASIAVVCVITFAFMLAPLIVGLGFVLLLLLYQASRH
jgi:hypothetical protein